MSGLGHVCEMHKVKEKYIEDIQWFDVEYGIYLTSKTGFFIFSRVPNINEILSYDWNKFHIRREIIEFQFITFSLECEQDSTLHAIHDVTLQKLAILNFSHSENNTFDIFKVWK